MNASERWNYACTAHQPLNSKDVWVSARRVIVPADAVRYGFRVTNVAFVYSAAAGALRRMTCVLYPIVERVLTNAAPKSVTTRLCEPSPAR